MAKKKAAKGTRRRSSKGSQTRGRTMSARGRSDDFQPDREFQERWKQNRMGRDLPEDNYSGKIIGGRMGERFGKKCFFITVKLLTPEGQKGREQELHFPCDSDWDQVYFRDTLAMLGYDPEEVDSDQFSAVAREVGGSGETISFGASVTKGKKGGTFVNYKLSRQRPE